MEYIPRELERKFLQMSNFFKAVLVTGARQIGKTTMLKHLAQGQGRTYISLDNLSARDLAKRDPALFLQTYKPPIIIDEVQFAPELLIQIKILCDRSEQTGLFWLTSSQHYNSIKNVQESLAGRLGILKLYSLSPNEMEGIVFDNELDFSFTSLQTRQTVVSKNDVLRVFEHIWKGGMPQLLHADTEQRNEYYNAYVSTCLMRDAMEFGGITDTLRFGRFLSACAAMISEQVNYRTLADYSEIAQPTAKEWLRLLEGMGIVYLLHPYRNSAIKRLAKTPKLYFCDTGFAANLSR